MFYFMYNDWKCALTDKLLISKNGLWSSRDYKEIRSRIELAKVKFMERKKILTSKMNLDLRKRIVKCLVWSVALYAAETWTISKTDMKRIEAFEMWIWRKMEKISWTAKVSNSEVLNRVNENRCVISTINWQKRRWLGHVLWHDVLYRDVLEGRMTGKRTRLVMTIKQIFRSCVRQ